MRGRNSDHDDADSTWKKTLKIGRQPRVCSAGSSLGNVTLSPRLAHPKFPTTFMDESPQNLYARNLRQSFGYPLRFPEPKPGLPLSYEERGLHIGDVGYVDDVGMFEVLFNICFPLDHELHKAGCKYLTNLVGLATLNQNETPDIPNTFPSGRVICHGIRESHGDNTQRYLVSYQHLEMRNNADLAS